MRTFKYFIYVNVIMKFFLQNKLILSRL